jgi:predicted extracellular nuclease
MKMKRLLTICLSFIVLISCKPDSATKEKLANVNQPEVKFPHQLLDTFSYAPMVFYNVENLFDTINDPQKKDDEFLPSAKKKWNAKRYQEKLVKLAQVITRIDDKNPIFIGLAEVENRFVVKDLLKTGRLQQTKYRIAHFESPDVRGIDVALAFDHTKFQLTKKEALNIEIEGKSDFKTRDILYVNGFLFDSTEVHLFVNHWSSRRGGQQESEYKRLAAARKLKEKSDEILAENSNANIIIMGDFNDYPTNSSIVDVLGAGPQNSDKSFVNLLLPYHLMGAGSYNYKGEWGALDQFIVSRSLLDNRGLEIQNGQALIMYDEDFLYTNKDGSKTPNRTYGGNNYYGGYSDHLAIYSILTMQ